MYQLLALLFIPLAGSGLVFVNKNSSGRIIALVIGFLQLLLTFYVLADFDFSPTVDPQLPYEINWQWSSFIKSRAHFGLDGMSMLFVLLTNLLVPFIILSSFTKDKKYRNTFYALTLLMQFGLVGVFTSLDGLMFYAFWEITLIPIWFIAGLWGQEDKRLKFTTKFFVYTFVGSLFMLAGLIYVYSLPDTASFALMDMYHTKMNFQQQNLVFWFIFFAFAVKLPLFPFHTWQADTYTYSPTQGSMLLSGIMLKMAIFGVLRFLLPITPEAIGGTSGGIVILLAVFGVIYGALIAIVQNDAKRLIAYSSLSHVGLMVAGIFASALLTVHGHYTIEGGSGALIMAFAHGINVVGLFYCADILARRFKTRDINQMGGFARVAPKFAILFMIILFGSLGVPLTNGFVGEFILIKSVFDYGHLLGIITGNTVILAAAYLLRFYAKTMFGKGNDDVLKNLKDVSNVEFSVLASITVLVILFGVFPQVVLDLVNSSLTFIYSNMMN